MATKKTDDKSTKDQSDADVKKALNTGQSLPTGTRLQFYGTRADDQGTGEPATGDDGNTPSSAAGTAGE